MHIIVTFLITTFIMLVTFFTLGRDLLNTYSNIVGSWFDFHGHTEQLSDTNLTTPIGQAVDEATTVSLTVVNEGEVPLGDFARWDVIFEIDTNPGLGIAYLAYTDGALSSNKWVKTGIYINGVSPLTTEIVDLGTLNPGEKMVIQAQPSTAISANTYDRATLVTPNGIAAKAIFQVNPFLYVLDETDRIVYRYSGSGAYLNSYTLDSFNANGKGITTKGSYFWVTDMTDDVVYKYTTAFSLDNNWTQTALNVNGVGIATDGTNIWIVDEVDDKVYKYDTSGAYVSDFTLNAANTDPTGITTDGTYIWVVDVVDDRVYKYTLSGTYLSSFALTAANSDPQAITVRNR